MTERDTTKRSFLKRAGWSDADISLLAGDASNRKYFRLVRPRTGERSVLMDAPPETGEDTRPFIAIAGYLRDIGLSAPGILSSDDDQGLLLLEDLGDDLFARVLEKDIGLEQELYGTATDVLVNLHTHAPPKDLATYTPAVMADMAALAFDWYADGAGHPNPDARAHLHANIETLLQSAASDASVLIQRDYHAENLLWLPERDGVARVGLLDFQDAMLGHPAYDLVSLLQDARRDVSPEIEDAMVTRYSQATAWEADAFQTAYHCLGAQRSLRILGVFARLCLRDGKPSYIDLIPRVWSHLQNDLTHPALEKVAVTLASTLPEPTHETLNRLKSKCA